MKSTVYSSTSISAAYPELNCGFNSRLPVRRFLIVFMTALDDEAIPDKALKTSGITCLRKPFSAHHLFDAIEKALR